MHGCDEDGKLDKDLSTERLDRKDFWIKTTYSLSNGFDERKRKFDNLTNIRFLFW